MPAPTVAQLRRFSEILNDFCDPAPQDVRALPWASVAHEMWPVLDPDMGAWLLVGNHDRFYWRWCDQCCSFTRYCEANGCGACISCRRHVGDVFAHGHSDGSIACCGCHCTCTRCPSCRSLEGSCNGTCSGRRHRQSRPIAGAGAWPYRKGDKLACTRMAGLEVEYNEAQDFQPISAWAGKWGASVHRDGSCGWEAVTAPAAGDHLYDQVSDLADALDAAKASVDFHCGVHVHVDARDLGWAAIERLCLVYAKIEPLLYLIGGQHRARTNEYGGSYCEPNGQRLGAAALAPTVARRRDHVIGAIYGVADGDRYLRAYPDPGKKHHERYKGLNLCPWVSGRAREAHDTTVEFRMHAACLNGTQLIEWAKLCATVVEWAAHHSTREIKSLPKSALRATCEVISPRSRDWILRRVVEAKNNYPVKRRFVRQDCTQGTMCIKGPKYTEDF